MSEHLAIIVASLIASVPATIAASAAWVTARRTDRKVSTTNGKTSGQLMEANYELTKATSHRLDEMSKSLEMHVLDVDMHCKEQTSYYHTHDGISDES